jgi:hypothetical protein
MKYKIVLLEGTKQTRGKVSRVSSFYKKLPSELKGVIKSLFAEMEKEGPKVSNYNFSVLDNHRPDETIYKIENINGTGLGITYAVPKSRHQSSFDWEKFYKLPSNYWIIIIIDIFVR